MPGAYRTKERLVEPPHMVKHLYSSTSDENSRELGLMDEEEKEKQKKKARIIAQQAKLSFMEMKEGLMRLR